MVIVAALAIGGQESLTRARDLYASAAYEDALRMLDAIQQSGPRPGEARDVALYRVFCLIALNREADAAKGIEGIVRGYPLYQPPEADTPPRIRTKFLDIRRALLPSVIKEVFARARASQDQRDFKAAVAGFDTVLLLAAEIGPTDTDWKSLASGFRELALTAADAAPPPAVPVAGRIYGPDSPGIAPPVTISQVIPPAPKEALESETATVTLELVIDQVGGVKSAVMLKGLQPAYDELLVEAARKWRFRPALLGGSPVLYRHAIVVAVRP
jgi:TonB family protein